MNSYHMISCDIITYHMISYPMISYDIISHHMISYDIISYDMISCDMISYRGRARGCRRGRGLAMQRKTWNFFQELYPGKSDLENWKNAKKNRLKKLYRTPYLKNQKIDDVMRFLTPGIMPKHSPKVPKTFWKNLMFDPPNFFGTCPEHVQIVYLNLS